MLLLSFTILAGMNGVAGEDCSFSNNAPRAAREAIEHIFPEQDVATSFPIELTQSEQETIHAACGSRWPSDTILVWLPQRNNSILGYVVVDEVQGRDQLITYLVAVDGRLAVRGVEILVYREPYGGEVAHKSWQRQFYGKTPEDRLRHGREIRNISGATISARAVTNGIRRILYTLRRLQQRLPQ